MHLGFWCQYRFDKRQGQNEFRKAVQQRENTSIFGAIVDHNRRPQYQLMPSKNSCVHSTQETLDSDAAPWSWIMASP
jgi:hypothetical protein